MSDVHYAEYDAQTIIAGAVARFEDALGVNLGSADERRILLMAFLSVVTELYAAIDDAGRQNLISYARGEYLDAIGDTRGVKRIAASPSRVNITFTLSAAQTRNVIIPAGTRLTPDGDVFFATDSALVIQAGQTAGSVTATCMSSGAATNGYAAGSISTLVDPIAYVASAVNADESSGGADEEQDDAYRARIRQSRAVYSTAGSREAYEYYARSADALVRDVYVSSPGAGKVRLTILATEDGVDAGGGVKQSVLDAVKAAVNADTVRPLTDSVEVKGAEAVKYNIDVKYFVASADESTAVAAIEGAGGALEEYAAWQGAELGRAINPDKLRAFLISAGAQWATVNQPALTQIDSDKYARMGTLTVSHEVIDA